MTHVAVFGGLPGIIILAKKVIMRQQVQKLEMFGSCLALVGCIITCLDLKAEKTEAEDTNILFGDFLAFISAIFATFYIEGSDKLKDKLSITQQGAILAFVASAVPILMGPLIFPEWSYSIEPLNGIFGWLSSENFLYTLFVMALISGCGTFTCYALCLKYFSPVVLGSIFLFEPITC